MFGMNVSISSSLQCSIDHVHVLAYAYDIPIPTFDEAVPRQRGPIERLLYCMKISRHRTGVDQVHSD